VVQTHVTEGHQHNTFESIKIECHINSHTGDTEGDGEVKKKTRNELKKRSNYWRKKETG